MSDAFHIVYASARRVIGSTGAVVVHVELDKSSEIAWIDVRSSGPGGPMSGARLARYLDGKWTENPTPDLNDLVEKTLEDARLKGLLNSNLPTP